MEDYIVESEKLSALTTISALTMSQPELPMILQENWNFTVPNAGQYSNQQCYCKCFIASVLVI
jgi:hypothetical protein